MINGKCFSDVDDFKYEIWPTEFYDIPIVGAWVQAESGRVAQIDKIIYTTRKGKKISSVDNETHPFIKIEIIKII